MKIPPESVKNLPKSDQIRLLLTVLVQHFALYVYFMLNYVLLGDKYT